MRPLSTGKGPTQVVGSFLEAGENSEDPLQISVLSTRSTPTSSRPSQVGPRSSPAVGKTISWITRRSCVASTPT